MLKPVITEKSYAKADQGWYTFMVGKEIKKNRARKLIEETFGVKILKVRSVTVKGKKRRSLRTRRIIKTPSFKKVIVKLAGDQKIDLFETGGK